MSSITIRNLPEETLRALRPALRHDPARGHDAGLQGGEVHATQGG